MGRGRRRDGAVGAVRAVVGVVGSAGGAAALAGVVTTALGVLAGFAGVAAAHGGGLRGAMPDALAVPTWLFLLTGGGAVGASFLLASLVTERGFLADLHGWRAELPPSDATGSGLAARSRRTVGRAVGPVGGAVGPVGGAVGLLGLGVVLVVALVGPADPRRNAAVLVVWVGWWAGLVAVSYLVWNPWPVIDPWRTLAGWLPAAERSLPERLGVWPATLALLALVFLETTSPLGSDPRLLGLVVLGYTLVTLAGAAVVGDDWFEQVDPVARLFRTYGRLAPVHRTESGLALRLPGSGLTDRPLDGPGEAAFVVALLWGTTFDGAVSTPAWGWLARTAVGAGLPPALVYLGGLAAGFAVFLAGLRLAAGAARWTAPTYRSGGALADRFAPSLVPIAAGYHLAHYLGFLLALSPALASALAAPLSQPASPPALALPGWLGAAPPLFVLAGHLLAVWVAHAVAFESFPGRLQAVRSQLPLTLAMVGYTTVSLWLVSQPSVPAPYV